MSAIETHVSPGPSPAQQAGSRRVQADAARPVSELLTELGGALDDAFSAPRRRWRGSVALAAMLAIALAAVGAVIGLVVSRSATTPHARALELTPGRIAAGETAGVRWQLTAHPCAGRGVTVSLVTSDGAASSACGSVAVPPTTLYDQPANVAFAFGSAPAAASVVEIVDSGGDQLRARLFAPRAAAAGHAVLYIGVFPLARIVTSITAYGAGSRLLEACSQGRCIAP